MNRLELFLGGSGDVMKTNTKGKNRKRKNVIASGRVLIREYMAVLRCRVLLDGIVEWRVLAGAGA
jgi:hypothetical protein